MIIMKLFQAIYFTNGLIDQSWLHIYLFYCTFFF